ncbi:MAG: GFA family protein [Alphaproteobacteria bacterium]|nr:GFA family protein [Alphaproteobacteria bacterium]
MAEIHEGGCVCGGVRYRTSGNPQRVGACSCTWCQRRTGSAFGISVYFNDEDVTFSQGAFKTYRLTSDAGRWIESQFCEVCGSTVTWTLEFLPGYRGIAGGSFDQPTFWYKLQRYVYARSKPDWLVLPEGIDIHEAMAPAPKR